MQVTPLVADVVKREVKAEGVFLHIESCRPKEQWTTGRVLKFEDCYYRLERSYEREGARPARQQPRVLRSDQRDREADQGFDRRGLRLHTPERRERERDRVRDGEARDDADHLARARGEEQ